MLFDLATVSEKVEQLLVDAITQKLTQQGIGIPVGEDGKPRKKRRGRKKKEVDVPKLDENGDIIETTPEELEERKRKEEEKAKKLEVSQTYTIGI